MGKKYIKTERQIKNEMFVIDSAIKSLPNEIEHLSERTFHSIVDEIRLKNMKEHLQEAKERKEKLMNELKEIEIK